MMVVQCSVVFCTGEPHDVQNQQFCFVFSVATGVDERVKGVCPKTAFLHLHPAFLLPMWSAKL